MVGGLIFTRPISSSFSLYTYANTYVHAYVCMQFLLTSFISLNFPCPLLFIAFSIYALFTFVITTVECILFCHFMYQIGGEKIENVFIHNNGINGRETNTKLSSTKAFRLFSLHRPLSLAWLFVCLFLYLV